MESESTVTSFRLLLAQFVARQGDDGASRQLPCLACGQMAGNAAPELRFEFQHPALIAVNDGDTDVILLPCFENDVLVRLDSKFGLLGSIGYCFVNGLDVGPHSSLFCCHLPLKLPVGPGNFLPRMVFILFFLPMTTSSSFTFLSLTMMDNGLPVL